MIISGACSLIAIVIMLIFKQMHATHLSNPTEQVKYDIPISAEMKEF